MDLDIFSLKPQEAFLYTGLLCYFLNILLEQGVGESREPFNRTITVKATEVPVSPLGENANLVEKTVNSMRSAGLEITRIVEFNP